MKIILIFLTCLFILSFVKCNQYNSPLINKVNLYSELNANETSSFNCSATNYTRKSQLLFLIFTVVPATNSYGVHYFYIGDIGFGILKIFLNFVLPAQLGVFIWELVNYIGNGNYPVDSNGCLFRA